MSDASDVVGLDVDIRPEDDLSLPEWAELLESVEEPDGPVTLEDVAVLEDGESYVSGEKMLEREKEAGLRAAKALERQQHLIPVEWRGKTLVFTGTVARFRFGRRHAACLFWNGGRWCLGWRWLGVSLDSDYRAVRVYHK